MLPTPWPDGCTKAPLLQPEHNEAKAYQPLEPYTSIHEISTSLLANRTELALVLLLDRRREQILLQVPTPLNWRFHFGFRLSCTTTSKISVNEADIIPEVQTILTDHGIPARSLRMAGTMLFTFPKHDPMRVHVVEAAVHSTSVDQKGHWTDWTAIPYEEMWADDRLWLPWFVEQAAEDGLSGPATATLPTFEGHFVFDGDPGLASQLIAHNCKRTDHDDEATFADIDSKDNNEEQSNTAFWHERPSALSKASKKDAFSSYPTISVSRLFECYQQDNRRLQTDPCQLGLSSLPSLASPSLRVCQWNINYLKYAICHGFPGKAVGAAQAMAEALLETNADVLILNEYGANALQSQQGYGSGTSLPILHQTLQAAGYSISVADTSYPTAVATRLPLAETNTATARSFNLDPFQIRGAVFVPVYVENKSNEPSLVLIVGTHLEDCDDNNGELRFEGMARLLEGIQQLHEENWFDAIIVAGDFNQQRQCDYKPSEWDAICANKQRRGSPTDDGVASLLQQAGFLCSYDHSTLFTTNWKPDDPPPSTHWSGTIVDYCYGKDCTKQKDGSSILKPRGIHVSPCDLSDHRLIVTDWELAAANTTSTGE